MLLSLLSDSDVNAKFIEMRLVSTKEEVGSGAGSPRTFVRLTPTEADGKTEARSR